MYYVLFLLFFFCCFFCLLFIYLIFFFFFCLLITMCMHSCHPLQFKSMKGENETIGVDNSASLGVSVFLLSQLLPRLPRRVTNSFRIATFFNNTV